MEWNDLESIVLAKGAEKNPNSHPASRNDVLRSVASIQSLLREARSFRLSICDEAKRSDAATNGKGKVVVPTKVQVMFLVRQKSLL